MNQVISEGSLRNWIRTAKSAHLDFYESITEEGRSEWSCKATIDGQIVDVVLHYEEERLKTWKSLSSAIDFQSRMTPKQQRVTIYRDTS